MSLYPLKFKPRLLEKMWAGRKIQSVLGRPLPDGKQIGESWEIYDFPPGEVDPSPQWMSAAVTDGPLAGKTLHDLMQTDQRQLLGDVPAAGKKGQFPLLIKFLDAREDLSIQVHPDRAYAASHANAHLKSEAWYIVQADAGAKLYIGLKTGTNRDQFKRAIAEGNCERLLNEVPVKAGDAFYLPSGTVHAIGAGIMAAEVQTPSDTTFRVYDFNRIDPSTGKTRKLHIEEALACIHFSPDAQSPPAARTQGLDANRRRLVACEFFEIEEVSLANGVKEPLAYKEPVIWMILDGRAELKADGVAEPIRFGRGDTVLLPAEMGHVSLATHSACKWLEVSF